MQAALDGRSESAGSAWLVMLMLEQRRWPLAEKAMIARSKMVTFNIPLRVNWYVVGFLEVRPDIRTPASLEWHRACIQAVTIVYWF